MLFNKQILIVLTSTTILTSSILALPQGIDQVQNSVDAAYWIAKDERNVSERIQQLKQIGMSYGYQGNLASTMQIADLVRRQAPPSVMVKLSGDFAVSLLNGPNNGSAIAYINGIRDANEKNATIETLGTELLRRNQLTAALETAQLLNNTARRNRLLLDVVLAYAAKGQPEAAVNVVNLITDASKDEGLYAIAAAYAERQDIAKSSETATFISNLTLQQKAQVKLLSERAKSNNLDGIQAAIKQLGSPSAQQRVLQYVAQSYIQNNRFADAQIVLDTITFVDIREAILASMAIQYAVNREFELSEKTLSQITISNRGTAAFGVAKVMAQDDNLDRAFELVNQLDASDRLVYLPKLAGEFGKSSQILFTQLIIKQIDPLPLQYEAIEQFLTAMAISNTSPAKVVRYAKEITDPVVRDRVLTAIATHYLNQKNTDASSEAIQSIVSPSLRNEMDIKVALQLAPSDSIARLQRIESNLLTIPAGARLVPLTQLSMSYHRVGQSEKAFQLLTIAAGIASTVTDLPMEARLQLIDAYTQIGRYSSAIQAIQTLSQNSQKIAALLKIQTWPNTNETRSAIQEIAREKK